MSNGVKILSNLDLQGNSLINSPQISNENSSISLEENKIKNASVSIDNAASSSITNTASSGSITSKASTGISNETSTGNITSTATEGNIVNTASEKITSTAKTIEIISPEIHVAADAGKDSSKIKIKWNPESNSLIFFKG